MVEFLHYHIRDLLGRLSLLKQTFHLQCQKFYSCTTIIRAGKEIDLQNLCNWYIVILCKMFAFIIDIAIYVAIGFTEIFEHL